MSAKVLKNLDNLRVTPNEYLSKYTLWRNLNKLLENDKALDQLFNGITKNLSISGYSPGVVYKYGDTVWYLRENKESFILLRSLIDNNNIPPEKDGNPFEDNGWELLSRDIDINELDIKNRIGQTVVQNFQSHVNEKHPYGPLNNTNISEKLLKRDLSNRTRDRDQFFYPYVTGFLNPDKAILNGMYRRYDNGLIEYDIVFRLGYEETRDVNGMMMDVLSCNNVEITQGGSNDKYFLDTDSYNIFNQVNQNPNNSSIVGTRTIIYNRNDYVNVYSATIKFPFMFSDIKYMIFTGDTLSQMEKASGNTYVVENTNHMTFCNKTLNSITALLVTYPKCNFEESGYNTANGGLAANSFRCKVIGRVKSS